MLNAHTHTSTICNHWRVRLFPRGVIVVNFHKTVESWHWLVVMVLMAGDSLCSLLLLVFCSLLEVESLLLHTMVYWASCCFFRIYWGLCFMYVLPCPLASSVFLGKARVTSCKWYLWCLNQAEDLSEAHHQCCHASKVKLCGFSSWQPHLKMLLTTFN